MIYPIPQNMTMEDLGGVLTLTRRWFSPVHIITFIFSLFWNGFMVMWYSLLSGFGEDPAMNPFILLFYIFPLLHVGVGVFLFYFSIAGFFNKTTFSVSWKAVEVHHGPLPWIGNLSLVPGDIQQIFTQERVTQNRNQTTTSYDLNVVLRDNKKITLVKGLATVDEGLFLEKTLEDRLGIKDTPVAGEVPKINNPGQV